ncbi:MAG: hypothetical protein C9356_12625 [Oleiphilus sp.]|nr:MAG: hypothetical protein C9356_12625 [Oleiphilus sp.]
MWILKSSTFQLVLIAMLTLSVFAAGLSGGFYFDDEWNVLRNSALQVEGLGIEQLWAAAMSGTAGPLGRPLATLTFAINHLFFGFDPYYFKLTNLVIHLACGAAVYAVSFSLSRQLYFGVEKYRKLFAALVALLWLLHPLNLTPVLYVVQRMTSLSALFCLLGMLAYIQARLSSTDQQLRSRLLLIVTYFICFPLGLLSKENAALLPVYCLLIELIFFRFRLGDGTLSKPLISLHIVLVLVPGLIILAYLLVSPEWVMGGYVRRDFTMLERLLTQPRILVFYLSQLILPLNSELALFHDDIRVSTGLFSPITTFFSILLIIGLLGTAFLQLKKRPLIAFSIMFYFCAHLLESSVLALELMHEHRNYLASFPILLCFAYYLVSLMEYKLKQGVLLSLMMLLFLAVSTTIRAALWGNPALQAWQEMVDHPNSARATYEIGKRYAIYANGLTESEQKTEAMEQAAEYFRKSSILRESYTDGLFGLLMLEGIEGVKMDAYFNGLLLNRLASGPFNNNNYNYLNAVFQCAEAGQCSYEPSRIARLIEACKLNPGFAGSHQKSLLARYERYKQQ